MRNPTIERANSSQAEQLSAISLAAKRHWGYPEAWIARWRDELTITPAYLEKHPVYTLNLDGAPLGLIALEQQPGYWEIAHLWILPQHMGKGYGNYLLEAVIPLLVDAGTELVVLSDPHAEAFYQKQGFVTVAKQESDFPGRFLPLMKKVFRGPG
jgi:GNAT superfamily N-acetyltransferase